MESAAALQILINGKFIRNGQHLSTSEAQGHMQIAWPNDPGKLYTVIFVDMDAPYPSPRDDKSPLLHWLEINIPGDEVEQGYEAMNYAPPNPPSDSPPHNYKVIVFEQPIHELGGRWGSRGTTKILPHPHSVRESFQLQQYINKHGLIKNMQLSFYVSASGAGIVPNDPVVAYTSNRYKPGVEQNLSPEEVKYCSCVAEVGAKDVTKGCKLGDLGESKCPNPYAVCHKAIPGVGRPKCGENYDLDHMSDEELRWEATEMKEPIPYPWNRSTLLARLKARKSQVPARV